MSKIVDACVCAEASLFSNEVPDVPQCGQVLAELIAGEQPLAFALFAQPIDQLNRGGAQRQLVRLALFDVRRWLDPEAGLLVELFPLRLHGLGRSSATQHDKANAVSRDTVILG